MQTLYLDGPEDGGQGIYHLVTETGEHVASHLCSHAGFARGDLVDRPVARNLAWQQRFPEHRVLWLGEDAMTREELIRRNEAWHAAEEGQACPQETPTT
jgi:hypothetical protein